MITACRPAHSRWITTRRRSPLGGIARGGRRAVHPAAADHRSARLDRRAVSRSRRARGDPAMSEVIAMSVDTVGDVGIVALPGVELISANIAAFKRDIAP